MPNLTPRWVLQYWGTEVCRKGFHDDIWIAALENKLRNSRDNIVISDCRFPNEIKSIKEAGGQIVCVNRGIQPHWVDIAIQANRGSANAQDWLKNEKIHASETAWVGTAFDHVFDNNGSIDELFAQVKGLVQDPLASSERPLYAGLSDSSHILS
jgi:hypothetical protein